MKCGMNAMKNNSPSSEHALITRMNTILGKKSVNAYYPGIGDDAAVRENDGENLILTTDLSVEGVHFTRDYMSMEEIGYRSMVANVSDCAAMGALPDGALVQLIIPEDDEHPANGVEEMYRGFSEACDRWDFPVVGGDISRGQQWVIGITLIGKMGGSRPLLRTGMVPGDEIWLSGCPGRSAAGLHLLKLRERGDIDRKWHGLIEAHIRPTPRIALGRWLAQNNLIHAAMDLSDGISKDCRTLSHESGYGIILTVDSSQVPEAMIQLSRDAGIRWQEWFLHGGEDYELLFAAEPGFNPAACTGIDPEVHCIRIGSCTDTVSEVMVFTAEGNVPLERGAFDHLK
jgi:thiamine-monophosphate kinase